MSKILFTGMHRSGTSAVSNLACYASCRNLLDDPRWAVIDATHPLYSDVFHVEFTKYDAFKVPRWGAFAPELLEGIDELKIVWVLRNPLDVWNSISERANQYPDTTMLRFPELKINAESSISTFNLAFHIYMNILVLIAERFPDRVAVVRYEDFFFDRNGAILQLCTEWLGWQVQRQIGSLTHIQFAPIRHKVGPIGGPGRSERSSQAVSVADLGQACKAYARALNRLRQTTGWMFQRPD